MMKKIIRNVKIAVKSMSSNKFLYFLSALGIIIGSASFVCMVSVGLGSRWLIKEQLATLGDNVIIIIPGQVAERSSFGENKETLKPEDVAAIKKIPGVRNASVGLISAFTVEYGASRIRPEVTGVSPSFQTIRLWGLQEGRFINDLDIEAFRKVCVIGETVRKKLFLRQNPLGEYMSIAGKSFQVVGILAPKGFSARGRDQDEVVYVPFSTMQERLLGQSHIGFALASAADKDSMDTAIDGIRRLLRERHNLKSHEEDDFTVMHQSEFTKTGMAISMTVTTLLGLAAGVSLIEGGITIMLLMLFLGQMKIREVGLRMALGARRKDIITQFFSEGLILSLFGAVIGLVLGVLISVVLSSWKGWAVVLSMPFLGATLVMAITIGVIFSIWPARKAARLNPIDALRYE